jgi:hypothetical protein
MFQQCSYHKALHRQVTNATRSTAAAAGEGPFFSIATSCLHSDTTMHDATDITNKRGNSVAICLTRTSVELVKQNYVQLNRN